MTDLLHRLGTIQDKITGHYKTVCGLAGRHYQGHKPFPANAGEALEAGENMIWLARAFTLVTCKKCQLKLTPTQEKIIRLILDHGPLLQYKSTKNGFEWSKERGLIIYGRPDSLRGLLQAAMVVDKVKTGFELTGNGRIWAKTLPAVKEDF